MSAGARTSDPSVGVANGVAGSAFLGAGRSPRSEEEQHEREKERETALAMLEGIPDSHRATLGADKGYDTEAFVAACRERNVTPHVAQNTTNRFSRIDPRTTGHPGYEISQRKRKRIEEVFGWMKTIGLMRKTRYRGRRRVGWTFTFTAAAYNLVRIRNLLEAT